MVIDISNQLVSGIVVSKQPTGTRLNETPFPIYRLLINGNIKEDRITWLERHRTLRPAIDQLASALHTFDTCFDEDVEKSLSARLLDGLNVTSTRPPLEKTNLNAEISYRSRKLALSILLLTIEMYSLNDRIAANDLPRIRNEFIERSARDLKIRNRNEQWAKAFLDTHNNDAELILDHVRNNGYLLKQVLEERKAASETETTNGNGSTIFVDELQNLDHNQLRALQRIADYGVASTESDFLSIFLDEIEQDVEQFLTYNSRYKQQALNRLEKDITLALKNKNGKQLSRQAILDLAKRQTLYFVGKTLEIEDEKIKVGLPTRRTFNSKLIIAGATVAGGLSTLGYVALNNNSLGENPMHSLQRRINDLINRYSTTDYKKLFQDACNIARANMQIDMTASKLEAEWNSKVFRVIALYLEPEPSDSFLRQDLIRLQTKHHELTNSQNLMLRKDAPEVALVIEELQKYFRGDLTKEAISQYLSRLPDEIKRHLQTSFRALISNQAITTMSISAPDYILSNLTTDLRKIFGDDYFRSIELRDLTTIQRPDNQYRASCTPSTILGSEVVRINNGKGKLLDIIMGTPLDNEMRRVRAAYVLRCFSSIQMYERVSNNLVSTVARLKNNNHELQMMSGNLTQTNIIEEANQKIRAMTNELDSFMTNIGPYGYVLTAFQVAAEGLSNPARQLGIDLNLSLNL